MKVTLTIDVDKALLTPPEPEVDTSLLGDDPDPKAVAAAVAKLTAEAAESLRTRVDKTIADIAVHAEKLGAVTVTTKE